MSKALVWAVCSICLLLAVNAGANEEKGKGVDGDSITINIETNTAQQQLQGGGGDGNGNATSTIKSTVPITGTISPHYPPPPVAPPEKKIPYLKHYVFVEEELFQSLDAVEEFFDEHGIILQSPLVAKNIGQNRSGGQAFEVRANELPSENQLFAFSVIIPGNYEAVIPAVLSLAKIATGHNQLYFSQQLISASYNHGKNAGFGGGGSHVGEATGMGSIGYNTGEGKALALPEYVLNCYVFFPDVEPTRAQKAEPLVMFPITGNITMELLNQAASVLAQKWDRTSPLMVTIESNRGDQNGWEKLAAQVVAGLRKSLIIQGIDDQFLINRLFYESRIIAPPAEGFGAPNALGRITITQK